MIVKNLSQFLWKLKNDCAPNTSFEDINLENIDYVLNAIFCRQVFKKMSKSKSEHELFKELNSLCETKPEFKKWVLKMNLQNNVFEKILKLNLINEKAKPNQA